MVVRSRESQEGPQALVQICQLISIKNKPKIAYPTTILAFRESTLHRCFSHKTVFVRTAHSI